MSKYYTDEKNVQVLLALLKGHGVRKVIASPGSANSPLTASLQYDSYFEVYSCVDERSAAYLACGLAAETGEPVIISCTGATASRNYLPGLTEAYYRKLPVLAITSTQQISRVGHHIAQVIDRSSKPEDTTKLSVTIPIIKDSEDQWDCEIKVNKAILDLKRQGGGPTHINLTTNSLSTYTTKELPKARVIHRITASDNFPCLSGKVAVFIGAHKNWSKQESEALDKFCAFNNAVVFCDHTSGYKGKYRILSALSGSQHLLDQSDCAPDILIHIGEITGDYASRRMVGKKVWRVSEDGEVRDTFRKLQYVFEMTEQNFFEYYTQEERTNFDSYLQLCKDKLVGLRGKIPELPFSNIWLASKMAHRIPDGSTIHFGILNSLRSWNLYELPASVSSASNVGGFGIDGCLSSLLGASFANKDKLYYSVIGDLAFFYDMNAIGNRHVGNNLRILIVNNGKGTEFRQYNHHTSHFGDTADEFIAAGGHFGNKSKDLVKSYSEALGFDYISASSKQDFEEVYERFLQPRITEKSMIFEVFTDSAEESMALELVVNLDGNIKGKAKQLVKGVLNDRATQALKKIIK